MSGNTVVSTNKRNVFKVVRLVTELPTLNIGREREMGRIETDYQKELVSFQNKSCNVI